MEGFRVRLTPQTTHRSRHLIEEWNAAICRMDYNRITYQSSTCGDVNSTTTFYLLVYAPLRQRLEESDMPPEELEATLSGELLDHLVASHDASGITETYLMHVLSQRKPLQRALGKELRRSTAYDSAPFTHRDINALPLLDAMLMETLRLFSANPGPKPRGVPATGCQVGRLFQYSCRHDCQRIQLHPAPERGGFPTTRGVAA